MIVFNEGLPGSGKTYDAIATHVLPALKKGRHVYARINGLDDPARVAKISDYLQLPLEDVLNRLHYISNDDVHIIASIVNKDALVVIDECHEFYVASREAMPKDKEELFAKHRHFGLDIVLISQYYKRLHSAVRGRVERKAIFTKLTVVKASSRYKVQHWQAIGPDKYEKVDAVVRKYDAAIFPLYKSVEDGTTNMAVYSSGSVSAFRKIGMYAIIVVPLAIWGIYTITRYFTGHTVVANHDKVPGMTVAPAPAVPLMATQPVVTQKSAQLDTNKKKGVDTAGMPAPIAYVFDIAAQARPRCAAIYTVQGSRSVHGIVEFHEAQAHVLERLSFEQLRQMGFVVAPDSWGVSLVYRANTIVATQWPLDMPGTVSQQTIAVVDSTPLYRPPAESRPFPQHYAQPSTASVRR